MNKNDLIAAAASSTGLSKAETIMAVGGVFHAVADTLTAGDDVRLVGFGAFTVSTAEQNRARWRSKIGPSRLAKRYSSFWP